MYCCDQYNSFCSPFAYVDPLHCNMAYLYLELLKDSLNEYAYAAELAGLNYDLQNTVYGMYVSIQITPPPLLIVLTSHRRPLIILRPGSGGSARPGLTGLTESFLWPNKTFLIYQTINLNLNYLFDIIWDCSVLKPVSHLAMNVWEKLVTKNYSTIVENVSVVVISLNFSWRLKVHNDVSAVSNVPAAGLSF